MSNKTERAVEAYFTRLLSEPELDRDIKAQPLQKLLSKVSAPATAPTTAKPARAKPAVTATATAEVTAPPKPALPVEEPVAKPKVEKSVVEPPKAALPATKPDPVPEVAPADTGAMLQESLPANFQVLYFEVAGLTLAVPLTSLGGIQKLKKVNQLFGKPAWFMGVQLNREQQINVVDTARWVMPEKYTDQLAQSLDYQYIILLGDSGWGLACERLVDADPLDHNEIKWRQTPGKRPWLAGTVKSRMCGLLAVDALVGLLEQGLNS